MKPFTFLTVVLGLILGFAYAAGRQTPVYTHVGPAQVRTHHVPVGREIARDDDEDAADDREEAEGLPVRIVPGTRVTDAEIQPPKRRSVRPPAPATRRHAPPVVATTDQAMSRPISGRLSATVERARDDARLQLEREVTGWLTPEVPTTWKPPGSLLTEMIRKTDVHPIVKDYGTVYEATVEADFSTRNRERLLEAHRREVVARRLTVLAGSLGFVLACLASLASYIRADEATRGYYTNWLRAVAAAGVGASGVVIYQFLT